ncbi:hypothetical protein Dimus_000748, partial [Dionaea muscipula]
TGENRRRDDDNEAPAEEEHEEAEAQNDFDWEAVIDEDADQGESGSGEKFYDAEDEVQDSPEVNEEVPAMHCTIFDSARGDKCQQESTPRVHLVIFQSLS